MSQTFKRILCPVDLSSFSLDALKLAVTLAETNDARLDVLHAWEAKEEDDRLIQVLSRIATQLGFALHHKRTEEIKQRPSESRSTNDVLLNENKLADQRDERLQERERQQEAIADLGRQAVGGADLSALMEIGKCRFGARFL